MEIGPMGLIGPLGPIGDVIYCSDEDFKTLVMLAEKLTRHAALMTLMLPEEEKLLDSQVKSKKAENVENWFEALGEKFTTAKAIEVGKQLGKSDRTIADWIKTMLEDKKIVKTNKGLYQKV